MLSLVVVTAVLSAEPLPKIAVITLQAEAGLAQGAANLLTDIVTTDLTQSKKFDVLSSADVQTLIGFERQKHLMGCNEDDSCLAEVSSALGVDLLVTGSVGTLGTVRVFTLRAYDAKRGRPAGRETTTAESDSALVDAAHGLVAKLFGLPPPVVVAKPAPPAPAPPQGPSAGWFVLGGGAVLAGVGALLGGLALGDFERFKAAPFDDALGNAAQGKAAAADVLFGSALVAGVVGVVLLVLPKPAPSALVPRVSANALTWELP